MVSSNSKVHILALDFDGVIADSIEECLIVGRNAFTKILGKTQRITRFKDLNAYHVREGKRLRNFIRSGEDYVFIFLSLHEKVHIRNQQNFDAFKNTRESLKDEYFNAFYHEREKLLQAHTKRWIKSNPLYPNIAFFLKNFSDKERLFIITTKKTTYVNKILSYHDIIPLKKNIYQADAKNPKPRIIKNLTTHHRISPPEVHFVDDQVDTCIKVSQTGVTCFLAGWGYNNEEQRVRAEKSGIPVLTLEDFFSKYSAAHL